MSQHDFTIANQSASNARTDINNALQALASTSSGGSPPSNPYAGQLWFDTVVTINSNYSVLKIRNKDNSAWISLLYVDNSTNEIKYFSNREVINTSDAVRGTLDRQNNADWTTGTSAVYSLVSPAQVKAAVNSFSPFSESFSVSGQTIGGSDTFAHGLSSEPKMCQLYLECTSDQHGWSVGEKIFIDYNNSSNVTSSTNIVGFDSTNIYVVTNTFPSFRIKPKGGGSAVYIGPSNWDYGVNLYA